MFDWLEEITERIIRENKNKDIITCQCGISTTGIAHIGNFREVIITYLVSERLKQKGKEVNLLLSFDDFDRFKKVPKGVPEEYKKYVGMPNYSFPSHIDNTIGYAEYYENRIKNELYKLGIHMDYLYQSKKYLNNDYLENIIFVLDNRKDIFDIIKKYKTQELNEDDKEHFYPVKVYCSKCNKDTTTIKEYDNNKKELLYKCNCGNVETSSLDKLKVKMNFNVEWPMRWNYESVDFEPCGKGHAEELGVLNVSRDINKNIYKQNNPITISYAFLNVKGNQGRMSKDSKDIITISNVLEVMPKEMILYYFLKSDYHKEMSLSLVDDIPKLYSEFEDFISSDNKEIKELLKINYYNTIKFNDLIRFLPISNFNLDKLKEYISFESTKENLEKIKYATNWLNTYYPNKYWIMNEKFNNEYFLSLTSERKENLYKFSELLKNINSFETQDAFLEKVNKEIINKKDFYFDFYKMVFNVDKGIPLKTLMKNYELELIKKLLPNKMTNITCLTTRIIHLSDLHFDISDNKEIISRKWDKLISELEKDKNRYDDYLVVSGDIVCFYNLKEDLELGYNYLSYLADQLNISKDKILVCTGNHEVDLCSSNEIDFEKLREYNSFVKKLCDIDISSFNDLYYIRDYKEFSALIINSFPIFENDDVKFYQNIERINELLLQNKFDNKYGFVISHAPYEYNKDLFDKTDISLYYKYNLCGHKFSKNIIRNKNGIIDLVSGNKDGIINNLNVYNTYELKNKNVNIKRLIYNNEWFYNDYKQINN